MAQLWGGRFTKETDKLVYNFNASISFDQKFYEQDIRGSKAHVAMLARQGILTAEEKDQIEAGLDGIEKQMELSPELKRSIRKLNKKEKEEMGINSLPENLNDALNEFHADELVKEVLGKDFTKYYLKAKKEEWLEYMEQVSEWELEQYLYRV